MRIVLNSNNIIRVLKLIWIKPGISRIEISKQLGLDKSTITIVVNRLMELAIIEETSSTPVVHNGGRPPIGLRIKEKVGVILGLEIQTDYYCATLIDLNGHILFTNRDVVKSGTDIISTFLDIYKQVYREIEKTGLPLLGVGVGFSGLINPYQGAIIDSNPLGVHEPLNFCDEIKIFIHVPVFIENDANCGCWADLVFNRESRHPDFLFVLGEFRKARLFEDDSRVLGVGMGVVVKERVHYGREFSAGEYKSPAWRSPNKTQFSISNEDLALMTDDKQIIESIKGELIRDIAYLTNILNLTRITFGGDIVNYFEYLKPDLEKAIINNSSYGSYNQVELTASSLKEYTVSYGAASMLLEHLFLTTENQSENPWTQKVGIDLLNSFSDTVQHFSKNRR